MKTRKFLSILSICAAAFLLTSCETSVTSAEDASEVSTLIITPSTDAEVTTEAFTEETPPDTESETATETGVPVIIENDPREFTLYGTSHSEDKFIDFTYDEVYDEVYKMYTVHKWWDDENLTKRYDEYPYQEENDAMFDSLGVPEIKELYFKASALWCFFKDGEEMWDLCYKNSGTDFVKAKLVTPSPTVKGGNNYYMETGIKSDSFLNALGEVYTDDAIEKMLELYPWYVFYNGEIWSQGLSGVFMPAVGAELKLTKQTDTEIEFQSILYDGVTVHVPHKGEVENPNEYRYTNRFVKTEEGWRAVEIATVSGTSLNPGLD